MNIIKQQYALVEVGILQLHPKNPNQGALQQIGESIDKNSFYGAIVVQKKSGYILAGNHRYQSALERNATHIPAIMVDCDDITAKKIMLADNRTARLGSDDPEALSKLLEELASEDDLIGTGYTNEDLTALLESLQPDPSTITEPEPLSAPLEQLRAKWKTEQGQLWLIPSQTDPAHTHRILCGDSTDPKTISKLLEQAIPNMIFADPPYGIAIVKKDGHVGTQSKIYKPVHGDGDTSIAKTTAKHLLEQYPNATHIWWGGNYYLTALQDSRCWLIWDKENDGMTFADAELAWTNQDSSVRIFRHMWNGVITASEKNAERFHPTQKPVALAVWAFENYGSIGDTILDPFLGSGMSLLAAEQTRRACYGIEYDPQYVAAILERCAQAGLEPTLASNTTRTPSKRSPKQKSSV